MKSIINSRYCHLTANFPRVFRLVRPCRSQGYYVIQEFSSSPVQILAGFTFWKSALIDWKLTWNVHCQPSNSKKALKGTHCKISWEICSRLHVDVLWLLSSSVSVWVSGWVWDILYHVCRNAWYPTNGDTVFRYVLYLCILSTTLFYSAYDLNVMVWLW